jgi:hypothetical protein
VKLSVAGVLVMAVVAVLAGTAAATGDSPAGFVEGSDSWPMPVGGAGPYLEPSIGGSYGGYVGMIGGWSWWLGCKGSFLAWSKTNSQQANVNLTRYGRGIGTAVYWFMGGPGVDPNYNGSTQEAYAWGRRQAARTVADLAKWQVPYRVVFMDIELPLINPAPDNGWNNVYTSPCSGRIRVKHIPAAVDRAEFNGFYDYLAHSDRVPGVYSSPAVWGAIFGGGVASRIPHTHEWTYEPETGDVALAPSGWCLRGNRACAQFFGGVTSTSPMALMWQWSGGGGVRNGVGDFDQIDTQNLK